MQEYASRVAYCIPILANAATCYDVSVQQTLEMQKEAGRMLCLEQNRFYVDIFCSTWLVTHLCWGQGKPPGVPGAQSVLRNPLNTPFRHCFQMLSIPVTQEPGRQIAQ